jgi:NADPH:quinone reductase-like Zn-dependent oxidoreductase
MKAIVYRSFGSPDVLSYEDIDKPTPGDDEVLIKVRAAGANPLDWKTMTGGPPIVRKLLERGKPKIRRCGADVAGQVEAVGRNVTDCRPGDEVFGTCRGAFAEYACSSQSGSFFKSALAKKPVNVTFEQAASAPVAAISALQGLRDKGRIRPGQKVLINGAAGGVGTFAVQIAKWFGADVTGVCGTRNVEMVRSIGADRVIDYSKEDFTKSEQRYDLVLDCIGNHSLSERRRILTPKGRCVMVGGPSDAGALDILAGVAAVLVSSWFSSRKMVVFLAKMNREDLTLVGELMATGKVVPVIDRRYGLSEAAEALRYLKKEHARGKVVITPEAR